MLANPLYKAVHADLEQALLGAKKDEGLRGGGGSGGGSEDGDGEGEGEGAAADGGTRSVGDDGGALLASN